MIIVCERHTKRGLSLFDAPHVETIEHKYSKRKCIFCENVAKFKLFYTTPGENLIFKIRYEMKLT
ncbi:hypothetical protein J2W47_005648 [Priestia megaterium]|nr:hypothetical protein [Priestia megaterium]